VLARAEGIPKAKPIINITALMMFLDIEPPTR